MIMLIVGIVLFAIYCAAAYIVHELLKEVEEEGKR
jgi:uncharacterized protein YpmB